MNLLNSHIVCQKKGLNYGQCKVKDYSNKFQLKLKLYVVKASVNLVGLGKLGRLGKIGRGF